MTIRPALVRGLVVAALPALAVSCGRSEPAPAEVASLRPAENGDEPRVELMELPFGGEFALTNQAGSPRRLSDFTGKPVLLFFGYTMCPDVCPLTMAKIASALRSVGAETRVQTLFVSVDVDRDTPAVLADYVRAFGVPLEGLTGTRAAVDAVVKQYRAEYEITPADGAAGHSVSHSTFTYLIDQRGRLRYLFRHADSAERIASGIRLVLDESPGS